MRRLGAYAALARLARTHADLIPVEAQKPEDKEWQDDWDDDLLDGDFVTQLRQELAQSAQPR